MMRENLRDVSRKCYMCDGFTSPKDPTHEILDIKSNDLNLFQLYCLSSLHLEPDISKIRYKREDGSTDTHHESLLDLQTLAHTWQLRWQNCTLRIRGMEKAYCSFFMSHETS
jgi:hypothetical protein